MSSYVTSTYQKIIDSLIKAMEQCSANDWQKPWYSGPTPCNINSKRPYTRVNKLALKLSAMSHGYSSPYWGTYNNWKDLGYSLKGCKATQVFLFKPKTEDSNFIFRVYNVFNQDQVAPGEYEKTLDTVEMLQCDEFDDMINKHNPSLKFGQDRACYIPSMDEIHMPDMRQFKSAELFYTTLAHELTHWTGHKSRLDRDLNNRFGDEAYAMEELIAELGAAFIGENFGIGAVTRQENAQYLKHWISVLGQEPKHIAFVAGRAQDAANYLVGE